MNNERLSPYSNDANNAEKAIYADHFHSSSPLDKILRVIDDASLEVFKSGKMELYEDLIKLRVELKLFLSSIGTIRSRE